MYCLHCGAAMSECARFCRTCGGEQTRQDQTEPTNRNRQHHLLQCLRHAL